MPDQISVKVNGAPILVPSGATAAVAMALAGQQCRTSVTGEPRGPLCAMGICFECRVTINSVPHCRGCQILCEPGMEVSSEV
jgi:D-hydroxyproline dehydrogenase subunit gamma